MLGSRVIVMSLLPGQIGANLDCTRFASREELIRIVDGVVHDDDDKKDVAA